MANIIPSPTIFKDSQLIDKFADWKRESFDGRPVFERTWQRNAWYILNRQWVYYDSQRGQWQDKRLAKWVPRPVTNMCKESVQTVRANFAAINYGANARPIGDDMRNVVTASVADDYAPILHDEHKMDTVLMEFDYNLLVYGNSWLHTCINYERANGLIEVAYETCAQCGQEYPENEIADAGQKCPQCGGTAFSPTIGPDGQPKVDQKAMPKGITIPLSPFEVAFPLVYERFELSPYVIRMRRREKTWYEQHPEFSQTYAKTLRFEKSPAERTMQIFKTLPYQSDMGIIPSYMGTGAGTEAEGITEYDVWIKPCNDFPDGQVIRFAGDSQPVVIHSEQEGLPGPLPYHDAKGNPLFTFSHGVYDHVGGRALGSSLIDPLIQKQDQLNQVDSLMLMIIMRTANPIWLEPKGAEVEKFTGEPGLVVKWNPLVAGGQAKPERIPGENIPASLFQYRANLKEEIEELAGTNDILKGNKPAGVEAFAALNLLVERGQARHTTAFKERGKCYKNWFKFALELEREFGPDERTQAVMQPTKGWAFEVFKKADLSGMVDIIIEDGTLTPKTALGERASIEHLSQLQLLRPDDPDQVYAIYQKFGQQSLLPGIDAQVQEAWMVFEQFEKALADPAIMNAFGQLVQTAAQVNAAAPPNPMMPPPAPPSLLKYKRWYNPQIHRNELIKWCISDRGRDIMAKYPAAEQMVDQYLGTIDIALQQAQMGIMDSNGIPLPPAPVDPNAAPGAASGGPPSAPGGAGRSAANSNQNAGGVGKQSSGAGGAKEPLGRAA